MQNDCNLLSNHFLKNLCFRLSLKPYILFWNFHEIMQSFDMRLGFHIDIQNFFQGKLNMSNSAQFSEIRKHKKKFLLIF